MNYAKSIYRGFIVLSVWMLFMVGVSLQAEAAPTQMKAPVESVHVAERIVVMLDVPYPVADNAEIRSAAGLPMSLSQLRPGMKIVATMQPVEGDNPHMLITHIQVTR